MKENYNKILKDLNILYIFIILIFCKMIIIKDSYITTFNWLYLFDIYFFNFIS